MKTASCPFSECCDYFGAAQHAIPPPPPLEPFCFLRSDLEACQSSTPCGVAIRAAHPLGSVIPATHGSEPCDREQSVRNGLTSHTTGECLWTYSVVLDLVIDRRWRLINEEPQRPAAVLATWRELQRQPRPFLNWSP